MLIQFIAEYLEYLQAERGLAQNTIDAYRRDLTSFCEFLIVFDNIDNLAEAKIFNNKTLLDIWNEIEVEIPLDFDIEKVKATLYKIINKNNVIDKVPEIAKKDIEDISTDYRIYYSEYTPIIYCKVNGDYVTYTLRYLVDPKNARYVQSSIWKHILLAHQNGEIKLYNKNIEYTEVKKNNTCKKTKKN